MEIGVGLSLMAPHRGPAVASGFQVDAAAFDGANDALSVGGNLVGALSASKFTFAGFFKISATATFQWIFLDQDTVAEAAFAVMIYQAGDNKIWCEAYGPVGELFQVTINTTVNDGAWHHLCVSIDTGFSAGNKLISAAVDRAAASVTVVADVSAAFNIGYASAVDWFFGGVPAYIQPSALECAEVWVSFVDYFDWSSATNLDKFMTAGGKPIDLGADGSAPTGIAPIIYLHLDNNEAPANFALNAGSGGNFTVTGALATAATSPSD